MTYRMRNILIAVALAGFAALLVTFYISNYKSSVQHGQSKVSVPVAAHDIAQGTLGADVLAHGWVTTKQIPHDAIVPGAITSPDEIRSLVATQPTYSGEQITRARFGPTAQQGFAGQITATQRAVQIAGDPNQTLAGVVKPGDYVDFEGTLGVSIGSNDSFSFSRTVVRNLKVLAVQTAVDPTAKITAGGSGSSSNSAVLLRMTDAQAQKIMLVVTAARASSAAYWAFELRPGLKSQDSPSSVETPFTILTDGIPPATLRSALGIAVIAQAAGGGH